MRDQNERLVLSLVRQNGSLAKTEIARMTRLSAQTVSVIMRELEDEGLLLRQAPMRGKVGQPSIPMALNPDGAYFIGLKIGRRSAELVLIDFLGNVRAMLQNSYRYPAPRETRRFRQRRHQAAARRASAPRRTSGSQGWGSRCPSSSGTGPTPRAPRARSWTNGGTATYAPTFRRICGFPVYLQNDATAACGAELVFGQTGNLSDFIYFYIGAFAGGGVVLNGRLYSGPTGNAGALGSMPVPGADGRLPS